MIRSRLNQVFKAVVSQPRCLIAGMALATLLAMPSFGDAHAANQVLTATRPHTVQSETRRAPVDAKHKSVETVSQRHLESPVVVRRDLDERDPRQLRDSREHDDRLAVAIPLHRLEPHVVSGRGRDGGDRGEWRGHGDRGGWRWRDGRWHDDRCYDRRDDWHEGCGERRWR